MKKNLFKTKVLGIAFVAAALALAACSEDKTTAEEDVITPPQEEVETPAEPTLYTAPLATVASSSDRVVMAGAKTKADETGKPGSLRLFATIENPSKQSNFANFEREDRYLSATSVYYDQATGTYYATYHMQGNNYNTTQTVETAGLIETFKLDGSGVPQLETIYRSADPAKLDFDFNHLYFDLLNDDYLAYTGSDKGSTRLVAVGHKTEPSSKADGKPNTCAIIATLDLTAGEIKYSPVLTGDKLLDKNGKSLGDEDAGDVNCVLRKANYYYLATRKGVALLSAKNDNLFAPMPNIITTVDESGKKTSYVDENSVYFLRTPGSAKYFVHMYTNSHFMLFYLADPNPETITASTESAARLVTFSMDTGSGTLCGSGTSDSSTDGPSILDASSIDITTWSPNVNQTKLPATVCPVDGKNMVAYNNDHNASYASLGKNGLYIFDPYCNHIGKVVKFSDAKDGSRPVNGVFVETYENFDGARVTNGFIYVANGACLTILDAETLELVAEYSDFERGKTDSSANYVHVVKTNNYTNGTSPDRIITVAYGQAGVKVFKFIPPTKK